MRRLLGNVDNVVNNAFDTQNMKMTRRFLIPVSLVGVVAALVAANWAMRADLASTSNSTEGNIAKLTAGLLEHSQFAHHPLDAELAGKFLDRYLDALDGMHLLFLQSDLEAFAPYRARLAKLTREEGDVSPAHVIFQRYLERLGQQVAYATNLLHTAKFDFTGNDSVVIDREKVPRPSDLATARKIWRGRVRNEYLQEQLSGKSRDEIVQTLTRRYTRLLQMMKKFSKDEVLEVYLDALAHVYDPHSNYFNHEQLDSFSISMNLSLSGIGATLQSKDGYCTILSLVPGGPAAKSGKLHPNDRIVAVAQPDQAAVDIVDMPLPQVVELIRGPKGTSVKLTLIPADAADDSVRKNITLVRDEVSLEEQRAKARVLDLPDGKDQTVRIGVIDLPSFYGEFTGKRSSESASATKDVSTLLRKLKELNVKGMVLDLRRNGGGSLEEAISLTGLFIRQGPVVQTRDPSGHVDVDDDPDAAAQYRRATGGADQSAYCFRLGDSGRRVAGLRTGTHCRGFLDVWQRHRAIGNPTGTADAPLWHQV